MSTTFVQAGTNLLKERPKLEEEFEKIIGGNLITNEEALRGVAIDTKNDILWVAGDSNRLIYNVNTTDASVNVSYPYPEDMTHCCGITMDYKGNIPYIMFLGSTSDSKGYIVRLKSTTDVTKNNLDEVSRYRMYDANQQVDGIEYSISAARGLTRKGFRYQTIMSGQGTVNYVYEFLDNGQVVKQYSLPYVCAGLCYTYNLTYVVKNPYSSSAIGLMKADNDFDNTDLLKNIEPFAEQVNHTGDLDIDQDVMWYVDGSKLYRYSMLYYVFLIDGEPYDDIDLGIIKAGGSKKQEVVLKNIADIYTLDGVTIAVVDEADNDADDMISVGMTENGAFGNAISIADPMGVDTEVHFWVQCEVPSTATADDNPRVAKLKVSSKIY